MSSQLKLDANPLSLVRGFPVKHIPIDKIAARDVEHDQIFIDKYSKYLTGKLKLFATRMQLERIKPGFYRPTPNGLDYICDKVSEDDVQYVVDLVRLGDRPALHLYHNINKEEETPFLCPDDVAPYYAYRKLGIRVVPVLVLGSSKSLEGSAITIRGFRCTWRHRGQVYLDNIPRRHEEARGGTRRHEEARGGTRRHEEARGGTSAEARARRHADGGTRTEARGRRHRGQDLITSNVRKRQVYPRD